MSAVAAAANEMVFNPARGNLLARYTARNRPPPLKRGIGTRRLIPKNTPTSINKHEIPFSVIHTYNKYLSPSNFHSREDRNHSRNEMRKQLKAIGIPKKFWDRNNMVTAAAIVANNFEREGYSLNNISADPEIQMRAFETFEKEFRNYHTPFSATPKKRKTHRRHN